MAQARPRGRGRQRGLARLTARAPCRRRPARADPALAGLQALGCSASTSVRRWRTNRLHVVVETALFISAAKAAGLGGDDLERIVERCARHPDAGDVIPGSNGARKLRFAGRDKGKSGGYRGITFYSGAGLPVLTMFAKGERTDLSQAERNALAQLTKALVASYRK
jgi:hypothetical protein